MSLNRKKKHFNKGNTNGYNQFFVSPEKCKKMTYLVSTIDDSIAKINTYKTIELID